MFETERTASAIESDGKRALSMFERLNDLRPLLPYDKQEIVMKLAADAFMLSKSLTNKAKELREKDTL
jgi:hypothetical protein